MLSIYDSWLSLIDVYKIMSILCTLHLSKASHTIEILIENLEIDETFSTSNELKRWKFQRKLNMTKQKIVQSAQTTDENKSNFNEIKFLQMNFNWKFLTGTLIKFFISRITAGKFMFCAFCCSLREKTIEQESFYRGGNLLIISNPRFLTFCCFCLLMKLNWRFMR